MPQMESIEYRRMFEVAPNLWWYRSLRAFLKKALESYVKPDAKLLDAGLGTGENMQFLTQLGYKVTGIELSKNAVSLAKKRGLKNIQQGSILELPFQSARFDGVYCTDVIGMFDGKNQKKAVAEFRRVLKKGGIVIVQCAALEQLRSTHDEVVNIHTRFSSDQLLQLFPDSKWQVLLHSYRFCWIFPLIAGIKWLKKHFTSGHEAKSDVFDIPVWVNELFFRLQLLEDWMITRWKVRMPIGSSVVLICRKQ